MYCEMCGTQNDDNAKVCKKCGFSFEVGSKNSKEDFEKKTKKFIKDNAEVIRKKTIAEVGAKSTVRVIKKIPIIGKVAIIIGIFAIIGFGIYYYIMTNNFFVAEKNETTGETYYVYYKNGYKVLDTDLFLRGNSYRVDYEGHRMQDEIYTDTDGYEYYYDKDGILQEGKWFEIDGEKRYANSNGIIVKNDWVDKYYLDYNGDIAKNRAVGDYFVDGNGEYVTNVWQDDHYYGNDGKIYRSTRTPDGRKVDRNGDIVVDPTSQVYGNNFRFGSIITFGEFEQDGDESNGPEQIEWYLLHGHQDTAYLISKNVLFTAPYQSEEFANGAQNKWDDSYLKHWLEGFFYTKAFDDTDKKYIYESENGLLFVPSVHDLELYLPNQYYRMCAPTNSAKESLKFSKTMKNFSLYWLRDDGVNAMHKKFVSDTGEIISDDVTKELQLTNNDFLNNNTINSFTGTDDKNAKDKFISGIAKYAVGQIPIIGDIMNESGLTEDLLEKIGGSTINNSGLKNSEVFNNIINSDNNINVSDEQIEQEVKQIINQTTTPIQLPEPVKTKIENPYINAGLVTNELMGVRPMIVLDMQANKKN